MSENIFSVFPNETFVDLTLVQFGRERCIPSHSFGPARRNHYLFHYVISGSGTLNADDENGNTKSYRIGKNQGFMIFPKQVNTYIADSDEPWEYVWIEFDGLRAREVVEMTGLTCDKPIYTAQSEGIAQMMKDEMMYIADNNNLSVFHLIGHLYLFLDYLMRSAPKARVPKGSKLRDFYVHEALVYIDRNYQDNITIEDIAGACGLNRSYFGKIFKEVIGKTPQEFLIDYRMIKAAELLKLSRMSVGEISAAVGYDNQLHFSRAFKKVYGVSPRNWRNENRVKL